MSLKLSLGGIFPGQIHNLRTDVLSVHAALRIEISRICYPFTYRNACTVVLICAESAKVPTQSSKRPEAPGIINSDSLLAAGLTPSRCHLCLFLNPQDLLLTFYPTLTPPPALTALMQAMIEQHFCI